MAFKDGLEEWLTDPVHGGKITCRVCNGFIDTREHYIKRGDTYEHLDSQGPECNRYNNYYGPGKGID